MSELMKVLLADPDTRARGLLARQLSTVAGDILEASDGASALELLGAGDVRVVVTELYLPAGGAPCLVEAIRASRALRRTHVVAYTHRCLAEDREWAMTAGADAFLIKPTRAERMRYVVSRVGSLKSRRPSLAEQRAAATAAGSSLDAARPDVVSEQPESPYRR